MNSTPSSAGSPGPADSQRRGSARSGTSGRTPATSAGSARAPAAGAPPAGSRRSPAAATSARPHAEPVPPPALPPRISGPQGSRRGPTALPLATPPPATTPVADSGRRSTPPPHPASRRGGDPVAEAQPGVRPLTARSLRGPGTGIVPPVPPAPPAPALTPVAGASGRSVSGSRRLSAVVAGASAAQLPIEADGDTPAGRRALDVSNQYRSQRAAAGRKNKIFGYILLGVISLLFLGSALGMFIYYRNVTVVRLEKEAQLAAFNSWIEHQQHDLGPRIEAATRALQPVYEDLPSGRSNPELTATLTARYAPALTAAGARYIWCRKSWKHGNQTMAVNLAPEAATLFLTLPAKAATLRQEVYPFANINGQVTQSGTAMLYWDGDRQLPVAVVTLVLAPPRPTPAPGQPPPEPIPPTQFTLWFDLPAFDADAQAYFDAGLSSGADPADSTPQ